MQIPFKEGGYGVPDLTLYYQASQLVSVISMLGPVQRKGWAQLESESVSQGALRELLWDRTVSQSHLIVPNPFLLASIST